MDGLDLVIIVAVKYLLMREHHAYFMLVIRCMWHVNIVYMQHINGHQTIQ